MKAIESFKPGEPDRSGKTVKLKAIHIAFLCSMMFVSWSLAQQDDFPFLRGPYLGQKLPGMTAVIFAAGFVSKRGFDEWGLAVNGDWTEIFFSRAEDDRASIMHTERLADSWSELKVAAFSGQNNDSHPVFSPDGLKLFFGSKRPCPGAKGEFNIWYSEKVNQIWNSPKSLGHPFIDQTVHAPSLSPDGDIYASGLVVFLKKSSGYEGPIKLIPHIAGQQPAVSPDGSYIVFSKRERDGFGGTDLYVSLKESDGCWSLPLNLGKEINTEYVESSPTISLDGRFLFFSRNGDIWWVSTGAIDKVRAHKE